MNCIDCEHALNFEVIGFIECKHPKVQNNTTNSCFEGKTHPRWCPLLKKNISNDFTLVKGNIAD